MSGRILVIDDVATNRALLKAKLSIAYYEVTTTDNGEDGIRIAREYQPDVVILDVMMPEIDGFEVCRRLKADPLTAHIPVIMITAFNSPEEWVLGLDAGADDFLPRPFKDLALFARVRNLMRVKIMIDELRLRDETTRNLGLAGWFETESPAEMAPASLLIAGDPDGTAMEHGDILAQRLSLGVHFAGGEKDVIAFNGWQAPDIFVVHYELSDGSDGLRIVSSLRARPDTRQSAIIFVGKDGDLESAAAALDLGASDYIMWPFDPNELVARIRSQLRRKQYSDQLRSNVIDGLKMAVLDPLTGLYNRRYAMRHVQSIIERARDEDNQFALMMLDLDEFKKVNDTYGHDCGDKVLKEFARRLQDNVRGVDLVARMGGEEFLVAMPETEVESAAFVAERVRLAIEATPVRIDADGGTVPITVSIGVAVASGHETDSEMVIRQADAALYESKERGRNMVCVFPEAA